MLMGASTFRILNSNNALSLLIYFYRFSNGFQKQNILVAHLQNNWYFHAFLILISVTYQANKDGRNKNQS